MFGISLEEKTSRGQNEEEESIHKGGEDSNSKSWGTFTKEGLASQDMKFLSDLAKLYKLKNRTKLMDNDSMTKKCELIDTLLAWQQSPEGSATYPSIK